MISHGAGFVLLTSRRLHSSDTQNRPIRSQGIPLQEGTSKHLKEAHHKTQQGKALLTAKYDTHKASQICTNEAETMVASLQACIQQKNLRRGRQLHDEIVDQGLLEKHPFLGNTIVTMYAKCGALEKAEELFDDLLVRTVVSWNALITAYAQYACGEKALDCFKRMQMEGFSPNLVTFLCVLKACGSIGAVEKGRELHAQISADPFLSRDIHVGTALIDMYAKSGALASAQEVFDELPSHNVVSWTALIGGYTQYGYDEEALFSFDRMERLGFSPNAITYACILKACGSIGAVCKGQKIHAAIVRDGVTEEGMIVGTALIDMYAGFGMLAEAQVVFDELCVRDIVSWNALIGGYAQLGKEGRVFSSFENLRKEGGLPSFVTFTILINTCSHQGLVEMSLRCFEILSKGFGMLPTLEHHTCVVDLLGRAGHLEKAVALIEGMPFSVNTTTLNTLLGACGNWGNLRLGRWVFEWALQQNEADSTTYVCMRNIYAAMGRLQDAAKIEALRVQKLA